MCVCVCVHESDMHVHDHTDGLKTGTRSEQSCIDISTLDVLRLCSLYSPVAHPHSGLTITVTVATITIGVVVTVAMMLNSCS